MRLRFLVCVMMFTILCLGGVAFSEPPSAVKKADPNGPLAQLEALGLPVEYGEISKDETSILSVSDRSKIDPAKVARINIGDIDDSLAEFPRLPKKVFGILPLFPNLRSVRFEYCWFEPDELRRLKEIPKLQSFSVHISYKGSRKSFKDADDLDFLEDLPELVSLQLTSSGLTDEMMDGLLPLKSLKHLDLRWNYDLTHAILPTLEKLPALEFLEMSNTSFAASRMEARRFAARLKSFSYSSSKVPKTPYSLEELREVVALPRHTWGHTHKTDVPLADIVALMPGPITSLRYRSYRNEINLGGADSSDQPFGICISRPLSDEDLATVGKMADLRSFSIVTNSPLGFTDDGLRKLAGLAKLEHLAIVVDDQWGAKEQSYYLTAKSLAALSTMPSLERVSLSPVNFGDDSLAWVRTTPKLTRLTLRKGLITGNSLAALADAKSLQYLDLGHNEVSGRDSSVVITKPTRPFTVDNLASVRLVSRNLTVDGCEAIGRMRSLRSLTLNGPITDAHLRQLTTLERLQSLNIIREGARGPALTPHGVQQLRGIKGHLNLRAPVSMPFIEQPMADQFNWFVDWGCGCCGAEAMRGLDWWAEDIDADRLRPKDTQGEKVHPSARYPKAARVRGPIELKRLVIGREDIPPSMNTLCLTDCRIETLHLKGWLPESIRIWGNSRIGRMVFSDVPDDATTELHYYFLDGEKKLTVPALKQLSRIVIARCGELESLRLVGIYPNLQSIELRSLDRLKYFAAPYQGDAPKLGFPNDLHWGSNLPALRLLKLPGTAVGGTPLTPKKEEGQAKAKEAGPRFPPSVQEVDLRDTAITDEWLRHLAAIPSLRVLKIGECTKLTAEGKAAFRKSRPGVFIDERSVHRPSG